MVLWLSQKREVGEVWGKRSLARKFLNHSISRVQCVATRYSTLQDNNAMTFCCFELQDSGQSPIMMRNPETDFLESPIPQSESDRAQIIGYTTFVDPRVTPWDCVPFRYHRRCLAAEMWVGP